MKRILIIGLTLLLGLSATAQTTFEEIKENPLKAGGVYFAYPTTQTSPTKPPKGYKPFHISHYGRHGSRYLINEKDYRNVLNAFEKADSAGALTPLGKDVLGRLREVMKEGEGRNGDLSPLGVRQHRGIAERMFADYPEVFKGETPVTARSTVVIRCVLSMDAFCERLKELNPKLKTDRESSDKYMYYLNYHSPESMAYTSDGWKTAYQKFEQEHVKTDRIISTLFADDDYVYNNITPADLVRGLYWIAVDMQDMETPVEFMDLFTDEELFDLWQCVNYRFYVCDGNYPGNGGLLLDNAKPLLNNIIETAEEAIASPQPSVALRFGHDGNLIPLAGLLRLEDCYYSEQDPQQFYAAFSDFKVAPMAGNVQLVFFRNEKNPADVLVKFLHNEKEVHIPIPTDNFPFYRWDDVRRFYQERVMPAPGGNYERVTK